MRRGGGGRRKGPGVREESERSHSVKGLGRGHAMKRKRRGVKEVMRDE